MIADGEPSERVLEVTEIGEGLGLLLPQDVLAELGLHPGDKVVLTRSPDGYRLARPSVQSHLQLGLAREIIKKRHNILRELAK